MSRTKKSTRIIVHVFVELAFALLPMLALGLMWPDHSQGHPKTFWWGPEISMISCILYGLTVSKLIVGSISADRVKFDPRELASIMNFLVLVHLIGVVISMVIITTLAAHTDSLRWFIAQYINLIISVVCFVVFGGYGIRLTDSD
jgi:hypothetical protein